MSWNRSGLAAVVCLITSLGVSPLGSAFAQVADNDYYSAYYDGNYGQILDGYWGRDGKYWYEDRSGNWHQDDGNHFQRDTAGLSASRAAAVHGVTNRRQSADMTRWEDKQKKFLAQAEDAEKKAAELEDSANRKTWLQIAKDYRDLAQLIEKLKPRE